MFMRSIYLALLMSLLLIATASVYAQEFVTDGLIAFYTLDEADIDGTTVKDVSGNGNDAKIIGKLKSVKGVIDECLEFDRVSSSYVEIPDMGEYEQVSVECWAYTVDLAHTYQGIISTWQWTAGKVHFKFESNEIQVDKNGAGKIRTPAEIDTWYHIIYTTDVPTALKLYVDGELVAEGGGGAEPENWHERRMGSEHDGRFLEGMIDEVRVYDRVLSEKEVEQNFNVTSNEMSVNFNDKVATRWGHFKEIMLSQ